MSKIQLSLDAWMRTPTTNGGVLEILVIIVLTLMVWSIIVDVIGLLKKP